MELKAEYSALSSIRSQKKKLKQTMQCPLDTVQVRDTGAIKSTFYLRA